MKIVCDACQAKYSISDDKVQGKVFKIRCKKCSNIIVVRGGAGAVEPAPAPPQEKDTRVYDYGYDGGDHAPAGDEPVWHVVINQDQVGPMTAVEVQQRFSGGEIDRETYIWREGFADWLPLAQVDSFAQLASAGPAASRSGADAVASMFGGGEDSITSASTATRSDPNDLFAAAGGSAAARHDDDGGDLFGSKPAAQSSQGGGAKLRGERNENSVLFSLNNLAQLASDKPAPAPSPASASSNAMAAAGGGSGGEGSGLIDIRSMASAYLGGSGGGAAKPASAGIGSIDDLPVFGGGGFSEPQVIVPFAARSGGGNNKLMYALIGSVGLLAVAAVIVVVVLLRGDKSAKVASVDPDKAEVKPAEAKPPEVKPLETPAVVVTAPGSADPAAPVPPVPAAKDPPKVATNDPAVAPNHPVAPAPPAHKTSSTPSVPKPPKPVADKLVPPTPKEPPVAKADPGASCDEVSCVLNNYEGACCAKFRKGGSKTATPSAGTPPKAGDLPDSLDRTMISDGVGKVKPRVMSCGDKSPAKGQVKVSVKVGPDGHVTSVTVKNTPDPGLGNCVASMMQKATFAKTQTGGSFAYPYTF